MAYSDFTLDSAIRAFALTLDQTIDLFAEVPERPISDYLKATLDENFPLANDIHTEKARSELIVVPILLEVRRAMGRKLGFFSGISFDVAPQQGLDGVCDFLLSRSPVQLILGPPVLAVVEAKNDNIKGGLGQCVAEMVAARMFNEREGQGPTVIFGAVTTGTLWRFLKLEGATIYVDRSDYFFDRLEKILACLVHCVGG